MTTADDLRISCFRSDLGHLVYYAEERRPFLWWSRWIEIPNTRNSDAADTRAAAQQQLEPLPSPMYFSRAIANEESRND